MTANKKRELLVKYGFIQPSTPLPVRQVKRRSVSKRVAKPRK